jgi:superfamily II DNA or RNA helicase
MSTVIQLAHNAITGKLINAPRDAKLLVQEVLGYKIEGAEYSALFQSHRWNGRASFFEFNPATFPAGFVYKVMARLIKAGYKVQLVRKPFPKPLGPEFPVVDTFGEDPRYDYQRKVPELLLKHGQIIAQIATGGGKSRIAKLCYSRIARPALFLTTRGILMHQMADAFKALKVPVGILGDGEYSPVRGMNCATVQTMVARLKEPNPKHPIEKQKAQVLRRAKTLKLLEFFELVILEEAHEASGNSYYEVMRLCKNAHYRLALTATPFMKDSEEANMRLMASSGPVAIQVSEKTLIDRGILATPKFKFIACPEKPQPSYKDAKGIVHKLYRSTPWQKAYEVGIMNNEFRNQAILFEASRAASYGLSVMILVQRSEHGNLLQAMLRDAGMRTKFIFGKHEQTERQDALRDLASGKIQALIGSTILDVGVDVPAVGMVILAGAGKAEVALRQRIGRGLREKKFGPNVCFIIDFADPLNNHLRSHSHARQQIILDTEGFKEGIVEDFDFPGMGFSRS